MLDLTKLESLLAQAQATIADLEAGHAVCAPDFVPPSLAIFIRELEGSSEQVQNQAAQIIAFVNAAEVLMERFQAVTGQPLRGGRR